MEVSGRLAKSLPTLFNQENKASPVTVMIFTLYHEYQTCWLLFAVGTQQSFQDFTYSIDVPRNLVYVK